MLFDSGIRYSLGVAELIGVDEAGRGPLAGPVVAAAVVLGREGLESLSQVRDSKLLSASWREALFEPICAQAKAVALAWSHPRQIERANILAATLASMRRAVNRVCRQRKSASACMVLVDGRFCIPELSLPQLAIIDGDNQSLAIACASVVAKVFRDRVMRRLDRRYPGYGLARHKGYGTDEHLRALKKLGPSPVHRRTFSPVREVLLP
ncbi:MAG: ribonuclease HII [Elusimicrobia bacterium RIFCSPHIGHO2_02_FULL_57_9]|nr:MAG: ribonuclease HII [Elusimicrobia bacterium RIFCSPHIGHO2_02_FULL_57_9]